MDKEQDFFENKMWLKVRPHWYLHPTPSLFTLSIYEIIYAALFKDYQFFF